MIYSDLVATLDLLGGIAFIIAGIYALSNYRHTKLLSSYWQVFAFAMFTGAAWAIMVALEWYGVSVVALDNAQQSVVASAIVLFAMSALLMHSEVARPE